MRTRTTLTALAMSALLLAGCGGVDVEYAAEYDSPEQFASVLNHVADLDCEEDPAAYTDSREKNGWMQFSCGPNAVGAIFASVDVRNEVVANAHERDDYEDGSVIYGKNWAYFGDAEDVDKLRPEIGGSLSKPRRDVRAEQNEAPEETAEEEDVEIVFTCRDEEFNWSNEFNSFEQAWEDLGDTERIDCSAGWDHEDQSIASSLHRFTDTESQALEVAEYRDMSSLPFLYSLCAEHLLGDFEASRRWSSAQAAEAAGAFTLCPDHPDRDEVERRIAGAAEAEAARERGERFHNGDYRVGVDIEPGTYVVEVEEAFDGCYWSRLNASGEIIANNFISSGFRAEVTIQSSDYSFSSERCGEWVKQ